MELPVNQRRPPRVLACPKLLADIFNSKGSSPVNGNCGNHYGSNTNSANNSVTCSPAVSALPSPISPATPEVADKLLEVLGGDELQAELKEAVVIDGHEGSFRTEFEVLVSGPLCSNKTVNLHVKACGGSLRLLWSLKTRLRGDGELQLGVVVHALSASAAGSDVRLMAIAYNNGDSATATTKSPTNNNNGSSVNNNVNNTFSSGSSSSSSSSSSPSVAPQATPTWEGICRPFASHERQMHEGRGLLILYPSHRLCFSPEIGGRARIAFATTVKPHTVMSPGLFQWLSTPHHAGSQRDLWDGASQTPGGSTHYSTVNCGVVTVKGNTSTIAHGHHQHSSNNNNNTNSSNGSSSSTALGANESIMEDEDATPRRREIMRKAGWM